jgi:excisionase family DNA binding protein
MTLSANHQTLNASAVEAVLRPAPEPLLLELSAAAALLAVSERTAKRLAADLPSLTVKIGRRRLFVRAKVEQWIDSGCPRTVTPRLRRR